MLGMPDEPKRLGAMGAFGDMWNAYLLKMEAERVRDRERQSERERERETQHLLIGVTFTECWCSCCRSLFSAPPLHKCLVLLSLQPDSLLLF